MDIALVGVVASHSGGMLVFDGEQRVLTWAPGTPHPRGLRPSAADLRGWLQLVCFTHVTGPTDLTSEQASVDVSRPAG